MERWSIAHIYWAATTASCPVGGSRAVLPPLGVEASAAAAAAAAAADED